MRTTGNETSKLGKMSLGPRFGYHDGAFVASVSPILMPLGPPGADAGINANQAKALWVIEFRNQVKNKGLGTSSKQVGNTNHSTTSTMA